MPVGRRPRSDALCPSCGSVERHRLLKLCMDANPPLIEGKAVLHFAPERVVARTLRALRPARYVSADLFDKADLKLDITAIDLPDASFETIVCNHVLEHVDDRKALTELHRVLKPGGTLLAMVPVIDGWAETFEPDSLKTPEERLAFLGHPGHLRLYGQDAALRFAAAGFEVSAFVADGWISTEAALLRGDRVFIAKKSSSPGV